MGVEELRKPVRYIKGISTEAGFDADTIVVEHRSNNPKRDYLFVNKHQCKHIPCSPSKMISMCDKLSSIINQRVSNKGRILAIGFAETATAIGEIVARKVKNCDYIMQTTRESVDGSKQLISFEEEHSHATTQLLLTYADNEHALNTNEYDYILFIEDEISTGNTIMNFINEFKKINSSMSYGVASVCNWQDEENKQRFVEAGVDTFCLISGEIVDSNAKMGVSDDNICRTTNVFNTDKTFGITDCRVGNKFRTFRLGHINKEEDTKRIFETAEQLVRKTGASSVRVVGTEEFMYLPIMIAHHIEQTFNCDVVCHSTTRSSIDVLGEYNKDFSNMICTKHKLHSIYDDCRCTYIYNTDLSRDLVIVVTDTTISKENIEEFVKAFNTKHLEIFYV